MKRNARTAFNALKKIGAPVRETDSHGAHFSISAEENYDETWADFYEGPSLERVDETTGEILWAFGVNPKIHNILKANGLYCEWWNAGVLGVYDR